MRTLPRDPSPVLRDLILIAILVFSSLARLPDPALAQGRSGSVSVRVGDAEYEAPIPQADVRLYIFSQGNFSYQSYADAGGRVTFGTVAVGKYTVIASARGYEPAQQEVDVVIGQASYAMLRLRHEGSAPRPKVDGAISSDSLSVPDGARKEFQAGSARLAADPTASIPHFRRAVELYPKYAEAYVMLAVAYLKLNQREDAKKAIGKAIEGDPNFSKAYTVRGRLLIEDREFHNAETALKESLRLNPQAWDAHFELARCYYNMGEIAKALEQAREARDNPQSDPVTHLLLADVLLKEHEQTLALAELDAFVRAEPNSPMIPKVQRKITQLRQQK